LKSSVSIRDKLVYRLSVLFILIVLLPIGIVTYFLYDLIIENQEENIYKVLRSGARYINTTFIHNSEIAAANAVRVRDDFRLYGELNSILNGNSDESELMNFLRSNYDFDCYYLRNASGSTDIFYSEKIKKNDGIISLKDLNVPSIDYYTQKFIVSVSVPVLIEGNEYFLTLAREIDNYNLYEVCKSLGFDFILFEDKDDVLYNKFSTIYDSYGFPAGKGSMSFERSNAETGTVFSYDLANRTRKIYLFELENFKQNQIGAATLIDNPGYVQSAQWHFIFLLLIFIILLIVLGVFLKSNIVTPIVELLNGIGNVSHQIESEQPIEPLDTGSAGEIGKLAEEFNKMASNLGMSFARIKYLQNYLLNIFESMPSGLIAVDNKGRVTQWNRTAEKYTSASDTIFKGEEVWSAVKDLGIYKDELLKLIEQKSHIEISREPMKDGVKMNLNIHLFPLVANGVKGSVIRIDDITELKKKEEQLIQAQKMETIGTLAGGIAHDFNNILSGIVGVVSILKYRIEKKIDIPQEQLSEYLDIMEKSGQRAGDIVQRLLTLSRKQNTLLEKVELSEVISHVIKICSNTFDKRIEIKGENLRSRSAVLADFTQLEQVILNLAINANHAMTIMREEKEPYGGILKFEICDEIPENEMMKLKNLKDKTEYVRISIKDTGVGMDVITVKQIFEPFFSTKEKSMGTGLGLTIVYNIVQQFDGIIDIDSIPAAGTEFRLYFPKYSTDGIEEKLQNSVVMKKGTGTVLVIDDEPVLRELARSMLGQAGYNVLTASDGNEGIKVYEQNRDKIGLILLDMIMPVMDGRETFRQLIKIDPGIKVMMTSGFAKDKRVEDVLAEGVMDFIQKPYTIYALTEKVYRIMYGEE